MRSLEPACSRIPRHCFLEDAFGRYTVKKAREMKVQSRACMQQNTEALLSGGCVWKVHSKESKGDESAV